MISVMDDEDSVRGASDWGRGARALPFFLPLRERLPTPRLQGALR